jgi:hypothetical protein
MKRKILLAMISLSLLSVSLCYSAISIDDITPKNTQQFVMWFVGVGAIVLAVYMFSSTGGTKSIIAIVLFLAFMIGVFMILLMIFGKSTQHISPGW